ncbi:MAG: polysaccharide biosynthesis protein [Idiomarina sp.]|nr:polysaccharide biosynthesis protein [Idiomarina sp.]
MIRQLTTLPRNTKRAIAVAIDIWALLFSYAFALSVRYEQFYIPQDPDVIFAFLASLPVSLLLFVRFGLYRAVVRYMALSALLVISSGVLSSAVVLAAAIWVLQAPVPLSVVITYALMSLILVGGLRLLMRALYEQRISRRKARVVIYGAGAAGRQLAQALINGAEYHPVCFVDDDETLQGSTMLGLQVYEPSHIPELIEQHAPKMVLLAIPSASRSERKEILEQLEPLRVSVQTIPGMADMVNGSMRIDELQDVRIEDLLGRDPVAPNRRLMDANIRNKVVMVTGAGGSIGAELCRQILRYEPKMLVLFEMAEFNLYAIENELLGIAQNEGLQIDIKPVLGSVLNEELMHDVMSQLNVDTVYHAAAYKHVPLVEFNVAEGIRNNIFGTWHTAEAALAAGVRNFVLISTDKAVRPTNVMGATKRFAELVLQGIAARQNEMTVSMVRFGNVLGSSGSVVPLFRKQIEAGGPVTVTDPEITRYFMTIPEAAQLVIQAGAMGALQAEQSNTAGGQVFVLDMGEPVKIDSLARKLIRLMGLEIKDANNPHGDIAIEYSGLRPGEKLYEELLIGEDVVETEHPRIMGARELALSWQEVTEYLEQIKVLLSARDIQALHAILQEAPLGFSPVTGVSDILWCSTSPLKFRSVTDIK